jgi:hypothetical protein
MRFARALLPVASLTLPVIVLAQTLKNPLDPSFSTIPLFIAGALEVLVMVALPIITFFIVYSGFKFISAQGNESKLTEAKHNFFYVIIGSLLILGAWIIATLIGGTVDQLTRGI